MVDTVVFIICILLLSLFIYKLCLFIFRFETNQEEREFPYGQTDLRRLTEPESDI